ncbi:MAG: hypothetical protein FWE95_08575, partial [Planctomycetaceae bacterium]|nr:hypothetical protein [Planctomycetaceae bacterium]
MSMFAPGKGDDTMHHSIRKDLERKEPGHLQVCMKPGDSLSGVRYIVLEVFFHNFTLTPGAPECLIY